MGTTSNKLPGCLLKSGPVFVPTLSSPDWDLLNRLESAEIGGFDNRQLSGDLTS